MDRPGQVVLDLGANVGFYTLLASKLVGKLGKVVAFEPAKRNLAYLRRHLALNDVGNCDVIEAAVSSGDATAFFAVSSLPVMGHISDTPGDADYEVRTVTLDRLVKENLVPIPDVIKCDIEGHEYEALVGASEILREKRPIVVLATHGAQVHGRCCKLLSELGYNVEALSEKKEVVTADELVAHPRNL